jgi:hypothetical protein
MWQVDNHTPFSVERSWVRDRDGSEVWLVAVRCTFMVHADGTTSIADKQDPVVPAPVYRGEPAASSLLYDSDFILTKPTTDVILHGSAYAPGGEPATSVLTNLRIGNLDKTLRVTGNRHYQRNLLGIGPGRPEPFISLPLVYERTYGGGKSNIQSGPDEFDSRNPVGLGYSPSAGELAPNINYPSGSKRRLPAGFGPIPSHWKPRRDFAGTYDDAWMKERHPLYPLDLDDRFFLCAPEDQRPARFLKGGEIVELTNLTPHGRLTFALPRVAFDFETIFYKGDRIHHTGTLYTVILEPDFSRVILVWRTSLPCHSIGHTLVSTVVKQKQVIRHGRARQERIT